MRWLCNEFEAKVSICDGCAAHLWDYGGEGDISIKSVHLVRWDHILIQVGGVTLSDFTVILDLQCDFTVDILSEAQHDITAC